MYAEIVGLMPCKKEVHVWMPHFNAYAVVGRKTINPIKNRREDFDYLDYSQPPLQLQPPFANSNGGGSGNSGQGPYDGVREGAAQQQPPHPEWLPSVQPSFCTVRSISLIAVRYHSRSNIPSQCEACLARYCNTQQALSPYESAHRHVAEEEAVRQQNIIFMMRGEPGWVERSDFTVPPPAPLLMPLPPLPPGEKKRHELMISTYNTPFILILFVSVSPSPNSSSGYIFYAPGSPLLSATPSSPGFPWSPMPPMPPSPTFPPTPVPLQPLQQQQQPQQQQQQPPVAPPCSCSICSLAAATATPSSASSGIFREGPKYYTYES